jgi:hypothetical protein
VLTLTAGKTAVDIARENAFDPYFPHMDLTQLLPFLQGELPKSFSRYEDDDIESEHDDIDDEGRPFISDEQSDRCCIIL